MTEVVLDILATDSRAGIFPVDSSSCCQNYTWTTVVIQII